MKAFSLNGAVMMVALSVLFAPHAVFSENLYEEMSTEKHLYARGLVRSVLPESQSVAIRPTKGTLISVVLDEQTKISGFKSLAELKKNNQVKVWYVPEGDTLRAVTILKLMDLGC